MLDTNIYSEVTPDIIQLAALSEKAGVIDSELFKKYDVKRGLRDVNGKGVLTGLTNISIVNATKVIDGKTVPAHGELYYRGYNVKDLITGHSADNHFGFEEVTYLLLFDKLPNDQELDEFKELLSFYRSLPTSFVRDVIMKAPSRDMMNSLARSVLTLYSYDDKADDVSLPNVLRQCLQLISTFPLLSIYSYQAYRYYHDGGSLHIHQPVWEYSTAENILHILRPDSKFTPLEAKILDIALILHMEHGGGNNSTFTTRVVTSAGTDTYSATAAALGSAVRAQGIEREIRARLPFADRKRLSVEDGIVRLRIPAGQDERLANASRIVGEVLAGVDALPVLPGEVEDIVTHTVHSGTFVQAPVGYHPTVASPGTRNTYLWCLGALRHSSRSYNLAVLDPAMENFNSAR